jgi:hypothetical protein
MLTSIVTHTLSALPLGSFHSALGGEVTGAGAGPRGQCRSAACPGAPQGALPVSGMPWLGIGSSVAGSVAVATSLALITLRSGPLLLCIWSSKGAGLGLETGGRLDRLHTRAHLWWGSRWSRRLLVVIGAWCPLTKPVVTAVELCVDRRAPLQPRRAARRYFRVRSAPRADSRGPGAGLPPGPQAPPMPAAALVLYIFGKQPLFRASRI